MPRDLQTASEVRDRNWWRECVALMWLALFLIVFFAQELPNNHLSRWDVLRATPFALLDALDPPQDADSPPRGLAYLGQRIPLWGVAALIAAGAWGLGTIVSRTLPSVRDTLSSAGLDRWERFYFHMLLGLSALSLATLGLGYCGVLSQPVFVVGLIGLATTGVAVQRSQPEAQATGHFKHEKHPPVACAPGSPWFLVAAAPFLIAMLLGSVTPPTDFDVKEYHLGGPKEWFQLGRITFLEHNVYTSFPFLTEMLLLDGMVVTGDWYWGGIAGQVVLMLFQPFTALGLWNFGRRHWSNTAGNVAALIYLSTPWVYRISIIAYAEGGLTAYLFAAFYAVSRSLFRDRDTEGHDTILAGLMAGSAMACKYPGLLTVVAPMGLWIAIFAIRQSSPTRWKNALLAVALYSAGVLAAVGPWLLKNAVETGNPVYPLAYSVFGGRDMNPAWAERFGAAHSKKFEATAMQEARSLAVKGVFDVAVLNDWQSPLIFAFAPLAFLWCGDRRTVRELWLYLAWVFLSWWCFMHYIDRFWVPLLPLGALLAGCGATRCERRWLQLLTGVVIAGCCLFNLVFCATGLGGYNAGLTDLNAARRIAENSSPVIRWLNEQHRAGAFPKDFKILSIGEAQLFDAEFPYVYNTVFDRSIFESWCASRPGEDALRDQAEIRQTFAEHGVTHVLVNWGEILRYRTNTYGYTDFARPASFQRLQAAGVLATPLTLPAAFSLRPMEAFKPSDAAAIRDWAPELVVPCGDGSCFVTTQVCPVIRAEGR